MIIHIVVHGYCVIMLMWSCSCVSQIDEEEGGDQFNMEINITDPKKVGDGFGSYMAYRVNTKVIISTKWPNNGLLYSWNSKMILAKEYGKNRQNVNLIHNNFSQMHYHSHGFKEQQKR